MHWRNSSNAAAAAGVHRSSTRDVYMLHDLPKWLSTNLEVRDEFTVKLDDPNEAHHVANKFWFG